MSSARIPTAREWDDGDAGRPVGVAAFGGLLFLVIAGHTLLETARDALLLAGPGPRALGVVYIAIALCTYPASALAGHASERFGTRAAFAGVLVSAALLAASTFLLPRGATSAILLYVASGVIASVVVPAFWTFVGAVLTVAQGRELFGTIAAAGVFGGVAGSGVATAALTVIAPKGLVLISAAFFLAARLLLARIRARERRRRGARASAAGGAAIAGDERSFLVRVAAIVFLSTCALLALDYLFKSAVNQSVPARDIGRFVARFYLLLNVLSLLVQLFVSRRLVARLGVALAVVIMPLLVFAGATAAAVSGGALVLVLLLKVIDGALRFSLHRIAAELVYLPLPLSVRERAKPLIDGALGRTAQTLMGAAFLILAGRCRALGPLAAVVAALTLAWLLVASTLRRPYLALLRRAVSRGEPAFSEGIGAIDRETAELLVKQLSSVDAQDVIGAMSLLRRGGRVDLIPALILLHPDEAVLRRALETLAASGRDDWNALATRLLADPREPVRMAAVRALARRGAVAAERLAADPSERIRGYAAIGLVSAGGAGAAAALGEAAPVDAPAGSARELGMLTAIADSPPEPRLQSLVRVLSDRPSTTGERTELLARAAAAQREEQTIPRLIELLAARPGREHVRRALVAFGDPALEALGSALRDPERARSVRIHVPRTLAHFGTQGAADRLLESVKNEQDSAVRYKSIVALESLARSGHVRIDRREVERLCREELARFFSLRALGSKLEDRGPSASDSPPDATGARVAQGLLRELLADKARQCLERVFRLLGVAHPHEDFRGAYRAFESNDEDARAIAGEFLDAKLHRRDQRELRSMFRLVFADRGGPESTGPAAARFARADSVVDRAAALRLLSSSGDPLVAELAARCTSGRGAAALTRPERPIEAAPAASRAADHEERIRV